MENGFKFSSSKTLGMHFCNKRGLHPDPELKLYNSPIKIVSETKFLGPYKLSTGDVLNAPSESRNP
jgi:hypothetical protein